MSVVEIEKDVIEVLHSSVSLTHKLFWYYIQENRKTMNINEGSKYTN